MDAQCPCIYCIAKVNYLFRKYPFCKLEYLEAAFRDKGWHHKCGDACVQRFLRILKTICSLCAFPVHL